MARTEPGYLGPAVRRLAGDHPDVDLETATDVAADGPEQVPGAHDSFGWRGERIRDLEGTFSARGTEMYAAHWLVARPEMIEGPLPEDCPAERWLGG